jgi:hypothetical protein
MQPMMPPHRQKDFEDLEASQLFCPTCKRAMPVRKHLFLGRICLRRLVELPDRLR